MSRHLNLTLQLETNRETEAARQAWAMVPEASRHLLTAFAAEVVALSEAEATGQHVSAVIVPAALVPALVQELAGRK